MRNHPRYFIVDTNQVVKSSCGTNTLEFIIFFDEYKLRGHYVHFLHKQEYYQGWYFHDPKIKNLSTLFNELKNIHCIYTTDIGIEKNQCKYCLITDPAKFARCNELITPVMLAEFVDIIKNVLIEIFEIPRFLTCNENRGKDKSCNLFTGLCDHRIIVKAITKEKANFYNVVTAYASYLQKLDYLKEKILRQYEKYCKGSTLKFCTEENWYF